jgi:hypothetical protein
MVSAQKLPKYLFFAGCALLILALLLPLYRQQITFVVQNQSGDILSREVMPPSGTIFEGHSPLGFFGFDLETFLSFLPAIGAIYLLVEFFRGKVQFTSKDRKLLFIVCGIALLSLLFWNLYWTSFSSVPGISLWVSLVGIILLVVTAFLAGSEAPVLPPASVLS